MFGTDNEVETNLKVAGVIGVMVLIPLTIGGLSALGVYAANSPLAIFSSAALGNALACGIPVALIIGIIEAVPTAIVWKCAEAGLQKWGR